MALGYYVKAAPAAKTVESILRFSEKMFPAEQVSCTLATNVGLSLNVRAPGEQLRSTTEVVRFVKLVEERAAILVVSASSTSPSTNHGMKYTTKDGLVGQLEFSFPDQEVLARAVAAIEGAFSPVSYHDELAGLSKAVDASALRSREIAADELKAQVEKLATFLSNLAIEDRQRRESFLEEQDKVLREKRDALDNEFRQRQADADAQFLQREQDLAKKIASHDEQVKKFKTIEAKVMRRELLERIDKVIWSMKDFSVSEATEKKRAPTKHMSYVIMTVSFLLVVAFLVLMSFERSRIPYLVAPTSGAFAAFMGTAVYLLRWNDRWFREHADNEFSAKRYQADILRASWVAELVSEWQAEVAGARPPAELIDAFTRHLFESTSSRDTEHPLEALAGMVKRVSSVTVGKGSISVHGSPARSEREEPVPSVHERKRKKDPKVEGSEETD